LLNSRNLILLFSEGWQRKDEKKSRESKGKPLSKINVGQKGTNISTRSFSKGGEKRCALGRMGSGTGVKTRGLGALEVEIARAFLPNY